MTFRILACAILFVVVYMATRSYTSIPKTNTPHPTTPRPTVSPTASPTATGVYVPNGWGTGWFAALSGTTLTRIAVVGDSITEGYSSTDWRKKSYVGLLRTAFQTLKGNGGSGFHSAHNAFPSATATVTQSHATASGDTMTWYDVYGTTLEVYYGGSFMVQVNALTAMTVSSTQAGLYVTSLPAGANTVKITSMRPVFGIRGKGTTGVMVDNYGIAGQTSGSFLASGGANLSANLVIYALGVNDANGQVGAAADVATFRSNLLQTVTSARAANPNVDIIILFPHIGNWQGSGPTYSAMESDILSIADQYNLAVIRMGIRFGNSYSTAQTACYWGNAVDGPTAGCGGAHPIHPSDIGHQFMASAVQSITTP